MVKMSLLSFVKKWTLLTIPLFPSYVLAQTGAINGFCALGAK